MINLHLVIMLEVQSTVAAPTLLSFEQASDSGFHRRVMAPSAAPIHPIPVVRTPITGDLDMRHAGDLTMVGEPSLAIWRLRRGERVPGIPSSPVPIVNPFGRGVEVSSVGPTAELDPSQMVQATKDRLADRGLVIIRPNPYCGVELAD